MFTGDWIHACNYVPNEEIQPDSPLIKAIRTGKRRTAMFLLEKGANVDGLDRFHMTALHWASRLGYEDLVKDLVSRKANINAICRLFECKPVDDAASHSHLDLALYLLEQGDDESAPLDRTLMPQLLGQACGIESLKAVRCLINAGAPLFLRDGERQNPRQKALSKGHHDIVEFIDQYI
jgi:ankyrin repeat protein